LYHVVWTAKKLARGELWTAKSCLDDYMKWRLLQMIEWHARLTRGVADTWHGGRFLERWADPRALAGLRQAFARYDAGEVKDALRATLELFHWLAVETGERMTYAYPFQAEEHVSKLVSKIL
jgi:aminoglycoside 6-adenylyltransferase